MSKPVLTITIQEKTAPGQWADVGYLTRITEASWEFLTNGFYGTATFTIQQLFGNEGIIELTTKTVKRLLFILDGSVVAVGILRRPVRVWDMLQTHTIAAIGPVDEMNNCYVQKTYTPPGGLQDLSWFYYMLAQDYILPRGFANYHQIAFVGVSRGSVTFDGSLRACITDLETLADGYMTWGLKYDPSGPYGSNMVFFVSKRDSSASPIYAPAVALAEYDETNDRYPAVVTTVEHTGEDQDLVNTLYITGGDLPFPNLAFNPSFESIKQGGTASANMLVNGSFDDAGFATPGWSAMSGASIHNQSFLPPHSSPNYLEMDHVGEGAWQLVSGVQAGQTYGLNFQIVNEDNPATTNTLVTRMKWYASDGMTLLQTDTATWANIINGTWDGRTQLALAPTGATKLRIEFEVTVLGTGSGTGHGVCVDTVILYNNNTIYQEGWRIETVATPTGTDTNADPTGLYMVDWEYDYLTTGHVSPGLSYGSYGIVLNAFGLVPGTNHVRLINSRDGNIQAEEFIYYTLAITVRATNQDGSTPAAGNNLRLGIVWGDDSSPPGSHNLLVKDLHITDTYAIVGANFQMPHHATACRLYFEALEPLIYYMDGVQFDRSPTVPTEFSPDTKAHFVITTHDVYGSGDPHYASVDPAPTGYGPLEEKVETPVVLTRVDAVRYAKTIFDIRSLPGATEAIHIVQVDTPLTIFQPDGYYQATGIAGYTFPKLWPARIGYTWDASGLECDLELEREVPRSEQTLKTERALAIVRVGTGVDPNAAYATPYYEEFTVGGANIVLSGGDTIATITLQNPILPAYAELFVRGFAIDIINNVSMSGTTVTITLTAPDAFVVGDKVLVYYLTTGDSQYKLRHDTFTSTGSGVQSYVCSMIPLTNSVRPFVRGFAVPPSDFNLLYDGSGNLNTVEILAGESLTIGDTIDLLYDADATELKLLLYDVQTLAGTETQYTFPVLPYQWSDNSSYAAMVWLRGMVFQPTITVTGGVASFPLPTIGAGDVLIVRWSSA